MTVAKVAVITRTRFRQRMLARAMKSVQSQTMSDFLWVIVNDGGEPEPVDRIVEQAKSAGIRTMVIHRDASKGMEAASNAGIRASESNYIAIHDDDDTWEPEFLSETARFLDEDTGHVGVVTHASRILERMRQESIEAVRRIPHAPDLQAVQIVDMTISNLYPPIAFVYRRSLFEALRGYDETMSILGDWDFNLRALLEGDIAVIPRRLANYHVRLKGSAGDPNYRNSITPQAAAQQVADAQYRNRKLRADIEGRRLGLGTLLMIARLHQRPSTMRTIGSNLGSWWRGKKDAR